MYSGLHNDAPGVSIHRSLSIGDDRNRRAEKTSARDPAAWAFEFLRRNEHFRRVAQKHVSESQIPVLDRIESFGEDSAMLAFGVLWCETADKPFEQSPVFWDPKIHAGVIDARIGNAHSGTAGAFGAIRLSDVGDALQIFANGPAPAQLLIGVGAPVQVNCLEGDPGAPNAVIIPIISPQRSLRRQLMNIRRLMSLGADNPAPGSYFRPHPKSARLLEVLTALDGSLARRPLRDIAIDNYGEDLVAADWAPEGGYLIERVRRSIRRGRALMAGDYKRLLQ
jgi:hypothetical protein